jgi:hypothetical protein
MRAFYYQRGVLVTSQHGGDINQKAGMSQVISMGLLPAARVGLKAD